MAELKIKRFTDNKLVSVPWREFLQAEDVCIMMCKQLNISTVARHLFALQDSSKGVYLHASAYIESKSSLTLDLRIRYKVGDILWLKKIDIKAFDYYFHQARNDVLHSKIPDLGFEKYRRELMGLGVTDMYRVMLEKDIPRESVESDYKKYIPKEVLKKHMFFIKKPIHEILGKIGKSGHDAWYVKEEYLKQLEVMSTDYPIEEYKALTDQNGSLLHIIIRVTPFHPKEAGVKYCIDSKREKWILICSIEELGFVSTRSDCTVEIYRKNGIPFYMKFTSLPKMQSFVSLLDGYYRLSVKWTFNICKELVTPSLFKLQRMKCHGPVGGEFSYAKLEEKRGNKHGCFILRESESKYNIIFVDVCMKDSLKPKTYKIERLNDEEFIFNDDLTRYENMGQLLQAYGDPQKPIYLLECLPPSEYDKSQLLLCKLVNMFGDSVTDDAEDKSVPSVPVCINIKDLQVYKRTYCYAVSENDERRIDKHFCGIRKCKSAECRMAGTGNDYIGKVSMTRSNRTCQFWKADLPIDLVKKYYQAKHKTDPDVEFEDYLLKPIFNVSEIPLTENKSGSILTDLFSLLNNSTKNDNATKEIRELNEMTSNSTKVVGILKDITEEIKSYINESLSEKLKFVKVHNVELGHLNDTLFADMLAERAQNFCRNPTRSLAGSWCYTMDKLVPKDVCNVPDCDRNEECTVFVKGEGHAQKKEGSEGFTYIYKGMWRHVKGKKMEIAMKILKTEHRERFMKDFLEMAGKWAFVQSNVIVRFFGLTLTSQLSVILEYVRLGPLDLYLRDNMSRIKAVDLVEAVSNLASALWHLSENGIVHGHIRCRKLLVSFHDENSFNVKLADPGIHSEYSPDEVHWLPPESYPNMNYAINTKTTAADVWAFGTTVWEIFMYGESIKHIDHVNAKKFYASGKRLSQPQTCPSDIYKLMLECWDADMHRRKQPQALSRDINQILYQVYNSRRVHAYAKIQNLYSHSTESIYSNFTESTNVTNQEDLISVYDMRDVDSNLSQTSLWSVNSWPNQDATNNEACGLSNIMGSFSYSTTTTSLESINAIQSIFELDDDCNVVLQGRIGQGFYGEVYKGMLEHIGDKERPPQLVAIKKLKSSAVSSCLRDFEREISIMKTLKHPNIVQILGVLQEPEISLVMEFVNHGSLQSYLKIYKDTLTSKQLLKYANDISEGMHYLGSKNIVHRDLAARNILVVDENHVKISDFGLAQVVINDYYILTTVRELPIKWYALESLRDGKFSIKTDVWSYGVTMCEMFSNGDEPNLPVSKTEGQEQQILLDALEKGTRFPCPIKCPQSVYVRVIYPCWYEDPHMRPTFQAIGFEIDQLLREY